MDSSTLSTASEALQLIAPVPRISVQSFCESTEVAAVIDEATKDRRLSKAHVKTHMGGIPAAIEAFRSAPTPNLIVIESDSDRSALVEQLESLAEFCDAGTKVMVVGHENDISLYRDLISRGVSDYVVAPIDPLGFIRQVSALYNGQNKETLGRVIAVVGAKGGVGASTISHNLAWSISRELNLQTIIADLDLPFGTAGLDFNQDPPQGIAEAVFSPERLDANFMDRLLSKCSDTLSILAAPVSIDRSYDLSEQSFEVLLDILRDTSPAVVLDVPHQWSGWTRRVLVGADEVAIVVTPDLANLRNAKILMDSLRTARPNDMSPHIIINMTGVPKRPEIPIADFAKAMELTPLGTIPFDPKLFGTATNNGQMLAEVEASSNIVATIDDMGQQLMGRGGSRRIKKKTLLGPLFRRFGVVKAG